MTAHTDEENARDLKIFFESEVANIKTIAANHIQASRQKDRAMIVLDDALRRLKTAIDE